MPKPPTIPPDPVPINEIRDVRRKLAKKMAAKAAASAIAQSHVALRFRGPGTVGGIYDVDFLKVVKNQSAKKRVVKKTKKTAAKKKAAKKAAKKRFK